jgi:hypothetical protein
VPLSGIGLFVILYIIATFFYPGGSYNDKLSKGFSWQHNYWCELLATYAKNGQLNPAKPVAIAAMSVLGLSLILFWYHCSQLFEKNSLTQLMIQYGGMVSVLAMFFIFIGPHDMIINISGAAGVAAMTLTMIGLYKQRWYGLLALGLFCLVLCAINNYIYYTGNFFENLAIIQKITFLIFLLWFSLVCVQLYRQHQALIKISGSQRSPYP